MRFDKFVSSLKKKYSIEEVGHLKVVRVSDPKTVFVDGVEIEVPNDAAYVFANDELVSFVEPEENPVQDAVRALSDDGLFEVSGGRLTRKKI